MADVFFNPMSHVLDCHYVEWEPATYKRDITKNKVMATVLAFFKTRHMLDEFWPDVLCIQNCVKAALTPNAVNQTWYAAVVGNYSIAIKKTSDGIYFVTGWAEDFHQFYDELSWIS